MKRAMRSFPAPLSPVIEDGRVDLRDASRQIERPKHRRTRADKTGRHRGIDLSQRATGLQLPFFLLERVGQLRQR